MKEVLTARDYDKLLPIIEYLEENPDISTQKAEQLIGMSSATAWRYLKKLITAEVLESDESTNNARYRKLDF